MTDGGYGQQPWQQQAGQPWTPQPPPSQGYQGQPGYQQQPGYQGQPQPGQYPGPSSGMPYSGQQQGYYHPGQYPQPNGPQKNRKPLIIGIIIAVVVLVGAGIGGGVLLMGNDKKSSSSKGGSGSSPSPKTPTTPAALMQKIRAADPCAIQSASALKKYGPNQSFTLHRAFNDCMATVSDQSNPSAASYTFELSLGVSYAQQDKAQDIAEQMGNFQVYKDNGITSALTDSCTYKLPYPGLDYAAKLEAHQILPGNSYPNWAERCQVTKEYLQAISSSILGLPARQGSPAGPTLAGKDPCASSRQAAAAFPGWTAGSPTYTTPYNCKIPLTNSSSQGSLALNIYWDINTAPGVISFGGTAKQIQLGGLTGVQNAGNNFGSGGGECTDSMVYKQADASDPNSAYLIRVDLQTTGAQLGVQPPSCDQLDQATTAVISGLGS